jgi:photosystem II stability/assembly factor-like uncharacterized protein
MHLGPWRRVLLATIVVAFLAALAVPAAAAPHGARGWPKYYSLSAVSFASADIGWAVGSGATIIKTTDGGRHWVRQGDPFRVETDPYTCVAAVSAKSCWIVGVGQVLRTTDGGKTWKRGARLRVTPVPTNAWTSVATAGRSTVWISSSCGDIAKSTNSGKTWTRVRRAVVGDDAFGALVCNGTSHAWIPADRAGYADCVFWTADGTTWQPSSIFYSWEYGVRLSGVATSSTSRVWAVGNLGAVFVSIDGGRTWAAASPETLPVPASFGTGQIDCVGDTVCVVGGESTGSAWVPDGMYSLGGGWARSTFYPKHGFDSTMAGLCMLTSKVGWAVGGMQVYKTVDGGISWRQIH